ncbi:SMP-30/gluconolactonase/LRE family protein [Rhizorhapis suberifaciens]|uniref:Sugar lactone lactonase YvrE n=1 Tax=Rhizorhapis suberifaciens TaxID=13656 RepID=A0A840HPR3_9SPHN|nr:SMP-30/gluconolactonase/LRE family protein [Rhizorhapis suberifaciens]MBB4639853.1 sugar lactone lactonase YvrE [Rhizorhapis suberifaciens]
MVDYRIIDRGETRDQLGEGLLWSRRENAVYWTDILSPALNRLSLASGQVDRWTMPDLIGWVIERRNAPGFIAGFRNGFAELRFDPVEVVPICDPEPHLPGNRLNDAVADQWGRIWAGTMPLDSDRAEGGLYRLDPDRSVVKVDSGYSVANGPAISPCQQWLYHTDSPARTIYRFELHEDGVLTGKQPFVRFLDDWGLPDGMTCDAEGYLWVAHWGGSRISRFASDGGFNCKIDLPASQITNICFAGENLDRMFVTSAAENMTSEVNAGCLFEVDAGVRGLEPGMFAG